ncbi:hypothetical protein [Polynucleobacter rarus]|uniref:hypothetical protein n=1 Tax=Polynucleobacter rarus TaxID=556055 RepID=UPI00131F35CA|nr:hypothetical protein [Polynucleobacter rarus]
MGCHRPQWSSDFYASHPRITSGADCFIRGCCSWRNRPERYALNADTPQATLSRLPYHGMDGFLPAVITRNPLSADRSSWRARVDDVSADAT